MRRALVYQDHKFEFLVHATSRQSLLKVVRDIRKRTMKTPPLCTICNVILLNYFKVIIAVSAELNRVDDVCRKFQEKIDRTLSPNSEKSSIN